MLRVLAAWNAAGWLYIALLGAMMFRCEVAGIRKQASLEDESRSAILVLTVLASAATMVAVGAQLSGLSTAKGLEGTALFTLSFSTILVSWFLVHFVLPSIMRTSFTAKRGALEAREPASIFMDSKVPTISIFSICRW